MLCGLPRRKIDVVIAAEFPRCGFDFGGRQVPRRRWFLTFGALTGGMPRLSFLTFGGLTGGYPPSVRYIAYPARMRGVIIATVLNSTCAFELSLDISKTLS